MGTFKTKEDAGAVEGYLQNSLTQKTGEVVDGVTHRRLGIQLHRHVAMGRKFSDSVECVTVFAVVANITDGNWDLRHDDPRRRLMEINGVEVQVVP